MFTPDERSIFEFSIGEERHAVDPIATIRMMYSHNEIDLERDYAVISDIGESMDKEQIESLTKIIEATRAAFSLPEFSDGHGVLDQEVLDILAKFFEFLTAIKKKPETSQTSLASSVGSEK